MYSAGQSVNAGPQPTLAATGSSVTVSWAATTLSGGGTVTTYSVQRYDTAGNPQTVGSNCSGTVDGLTCTELNVPNGTWQYSVTPVVGAWHGAASTRSSVSLPVPTVTSTSPASRPQGATAQNVTVSGTNFVSGATVTVSGSGVTVDSTTFVSATQVTANLTIASTAATGARNVTVTNPSSANGTCNGCFTVNAAPTVTSTSPSSRGQGATAQNVTVTGSNFVSGAVVTVSGSGVTVNSTTFVSVTQLTANLTIASTATTGARNVTVSNADGGAGSCTGCFSVNGAPTVTSTSPSSRGQGATAQNVTVIGTNFVSGAVVTVSGSGVTVNSTTFVSATQLAANLTIASTATTGTRSITATNADGGAGSCTSCFSVNAAPTVASASPSSRGQGATAQNVTVTGTNFVSGAVVTVSGSGVTVNSTTFVSATQLTANLTIASTATTGTRSITATNADGGAVSCTSCFSVNAAPTVASTSPSSFAQGATAQNVTVTGTKFVSGAVVTVSGSGVTVNSTTFVSATQLTANLTVASTATPGARNVTVTNADGGTGSCTSCFTVNAVVSASAMGSTVDTTTGAGSTATSVSSVATSSGQKFLVFVYRNSSCKTGDSITSISGSAVTSAQQQTTLHIENNLDLFAWVATGSGTTGAVTINFTTTCTNTVTVVNIVGLSGYNTTTPIAQSPTNTGNSTSAAATLSSPSAANGEVVFLGIQGGVVTVTRPTGFSQLLFNSGSQGGSYDAGSYFNPQASASSTFTLSTKQVWGTIALEINHG